MFCIAVPMYDLVHLVETIFHLHLLQTASENLFRNMNLIILYVNLTISNANLLKF